MASAYKQFLASPNPSLLADDAALHYVTTTTSLKGVDDITRHLNQLQKQVHKKKEDVLNVIDGGNSVVFEVDTTLEFQTSGGAYLPGLDDNFLTDREVYLPITHIVAIDGNGKIAQIRLQWDQASLLKQLEIIGKSGRNWPIKDSREQLTFIHSCLKAAAGGDEAQIKAGLPTRTRGETSSLRSLGSREEREAAAAATVASPSASHRPQQRSFTDILGDQPENEYPESSHSRVTSRTGSQRPQQRSFTDILGDEPPEGTADPASLVSPNKAGGGKNYQPMRLFDQDVELDDTPKGNKKDSYIRPNPSKYQHFDFADGSDPSDAPKPGMSLDQKPKSKHDSQWSFDDFMTPQKPIASRAVRAQDVRHWDTDKDTMGETPAQPTVKPRRDAETHFELQDDGEEVPRRGGSGARAGVSTRNEGLGLYKNKLFDREDPTPGANRALGNITNLNHRGKDFDAHWEMTDDSPAQAPAPKSENIPANRMKAVRMMDANWSSYDESPKEKAGPPLSKAREDKGINIAGDGMGGRKGTARNFLYGDDEVDETPMPAARKVNQKENQRFGQPQKNSGINIAGDGMGGRKGTARDYIFGGGD